MGGSSSSSSRQRTSSTNSQVSLDGDNGGLILSNVSGSSIVLSDHESIKESFSLADKSISSSHETARHAIDYSEYATSGILDFANFVVEETNEAAHDNLVFTSNAISDNLKSSLAFVNEENKPDGGLTVDIIKPLSYGFALVFTAYLLMRSKR